jgi:anti-anti-sigma regulatory factor
MSEFVMLDLTAPTSAPLPARLTIRQAEDIRDRLLAALHDRQDIIIDCSATTEVDLTFIQLVLAARKSAAAAGKHLSLVPPGNGLLTEVLQQAGLVGAPDMLPADKSFWCNEEARGGENRSDSR